MNEGLTLRRIRAFLHGLSGVLFVGTIVELLLVGHAEDLIQIVPFVLCVLGLVALAAVWLRPGRSTVLALRIVMIAVVLGSLVGVAEHFEGNLELGRETQPNADAMRLLTAGLAGGNPLLAPGILAISGALAMAATYSASDRESSWETRGDTG